MWTLLKPSHQHSMEGKKQTSSSPFMRVRQCRRNRVIVYFHLEMAYTWKTAGRRRIRPITMTHQSKTTILRTSCKLKRPGPYVYRFALKWVDGSFWATARTLDTRTLALNPRFPRPPRLSFLGLRDDDAVTPTRASKKAGLDICTIRMSYPMRGGSVRPSVRRGSQHRVAASPHRRGDVSTCQIRIWGAWLSSLKKNISS